MDAMIIIEVRMLWDAFLTGFLLAILYGALLVPRSLWKHKKAVTVVEDLLFWMLAAGIFFFFLYRENDGIVRGFFIVAAAFGMAAGYWILQMFLMKPLKKILNAITIHYKRRKRRKEARKKHGKQEKKKSKKTD